MFELYYKQWINIVKLYNNDRKNNKLDIVGRDRLG